MLELTNRALQAIAILVSIALVAWALGLNLAPKADAASVTNFSDLITDSAPGQAANHTLTFTMPNGMAIGQTFVLSFPAGFDMAAIIEDDVDLTDDAAEQTTDTAAGAGQWGVAVGTPTAQDITFTTPTDGGVGSSSVMVVQIGTHADASGTGANQIINHATPNSYEINLTGTAPDSGNTRIVVVDNVLVTATVDTVFDFTVSGRPTSTLVNGSPTTTVAASTDTLLPFGTLSANTSVTLAQGLNVTTNAIHGFVVTVEQDNNLQSSTGADIDGFVDGSYTDTPQAWANPANTLSDEDTWGHWALTTTDTDLEGAGTDFLADQWVAASTTPRAVMAYDDPADGVTAGVGSTTVGYQVGITPLQEAADDYNTTLTYIATPTF